MPLEKPKKPTELVPRAFGGIKNNFSDDLQSTGFEPNIPQTYNGDNLNYHLDATGKELDYVEKVVDYINEMPVGSALYVNSNNQLDYTNVGDFANKADKDLANTGLITNCLLEVPQNIKMELNNGLLTLKTGSIVIVPTGTIDRTSEYPVGSRFLNDNLKVAHTQFVDGKFTVWAETTKDITYYEPTPTKVTDKYLLYLRIDNCQLFRRASASQSGTSTPSGFNSVYYNLETNYCKTYYSNNSTEYYSSLPLGRISSNTNATNNISKIDDVFNGFGEIGSTVWLDKGVKALIPNGRNADGTLKNIEVTSTQFSFAQVSTSDTRNLPFFINQNGVIAMRLGVYREQDTMPNDDTYLVWFDTNSNLMKRSSDSGATWQNLTICYLGDYQQANSSIHTFETKKAFRAVDYQEYKEELGKKLDVNQITNCITEIPQNIKLELADGVLTLKAGSKVIVPNGVGVFDEVTITNDISTTSTLTTGASFVYYREATNDLVFSTVSATGSGTTPPSSGVYYNTSTNTINNINSSGVINDTRSLPLGIVQRTGAISSIDKVFNGLGFIGSTIFANKGIKYLISNGRNEDGTLKNLEVETTKVSTISIATPRTDTYITLMANGQISISSILSSGLAYYDEEKNLFYQNHLDKGGASCPVGIFNCSTTGVDKFEPKFAFRTVDYNDALLKSDKAEIINWGMPDYSSGIDPTFPFTAPSDGVLYFSLLINNSNGNFFINDVFVAFYSDNADGAVRDNYTFIVSKGDVVSGVGFEYARFFPLKGAK